MDAFISVFEHNHAGVAAPERDSHVTHGFWAKWVLLGNAIYPAPIPLFPFSPSTDLSTGLDSPETGGCPTPAEAHYPSSSGMLRLGDAAWLSALRSQAQEGITGARNISCVSRPLCPGHELQLTAEN